MKKKLLNVLLLTSVIVGSSLTVCAQPETMPDGTIFDAEYYAETYPDVAAAIGTDENALYQHYVAHGRAEGRKPVNQAADNTIGNPTIDTENLSAYPTVAQETEGITYVVRKGLCKVDTSNNIGLMQMDSLMDIKIYALGGNTRWVWCKIMADDRYRQLQSYNNDLSNVIIRERQLDTAYVQSMIASATSRLQIDLSGINFVKRTDFPDGLKDADGNGIDDRDPINGMGFIDLNHNGIDDRQVMLFDAAGRTEEVNDFYAKTDAKLYPTQNGAMGNSVFHSNFFSYGSSIYGGYVCPHNVICSADKEFTHWVLLIEDAKTANNALMGKAVYLDVPCPECNKEAYRCKAISDELEALLKPFRDAEKAKRAAEYLGYSVGSTIQLIGGEVYTYQGNDVWVSPSGEKGWTIIKLDPGRSAQEIYNSRHIGLIFTM